jgi:hypothetical protein
MRASKPILNKWNGIKEDTKFESKYFLDVDMELNTTDIQQACHTCALGSITVLDRLTGYGGYIRDIETGYRDLHGEFWLASGNFNIIEKGCETFGEAIALIKKNANNSIGKEHDEQYPIQRAKKLEAKVEELSKMIAHGNADILLNWMKAHANVSDQRDALEARVKELEAELCKLKKTYDIMSAYAVHFTPEHRTQELIKEVNDAYNTEQFEQTQAGGVLSAKRIDYRGDDE